MTNQRLIAADAIFVVLYIGLAAAFVGLLAAVGLLYAAGYELDALHIGAAAGAVVGLFVLPLMPRLYRTLLRQPFTWRENTIFGSVIEN